MKIGIDARCLERERGGVARIVSNMLRFWPNLAPQHNFYLYFSKGVPDDDYLRHPLFQHRIIRGPNFIKRHALLSEQFLLPFEIRRDKLDLFFATSYTAPLYCPCPKTIVAAWDISYSTHRSHYRWQSALGMSFFSRIACQHAAGVVTCSPFDGRQIEAFYKIPPERICVMQLAAEEKFKQPVDPRALETLRKKYNLPKRYILSMGVILNRRNVPVLIEAFKKIRQDFPDAGLVVAGRNSTEPRVDFEELLKPLTERGQGAYITMVPEDELALFYAAASYYVCTSTVDGEALMLKESLLCGTPVITSPLLEETIGGNALLIKDPTNVPETVHILRQALSIKDMDRKNTARIGREWVSALSWEKAARNCMEFIEKA